MENSFEFDDDDLFLAAIEQVEQNQQRETKDNNHESIIDIDDFDDDFDDDALIRAAETVEQQVATTHKGKERQGQLTSFFTLRSTPSTTSPTRTTTTSRSSIAESSTTAAAAAAHNSSSSSRNINDDLLPSRRLEDESPPPAPAPPNINTPCAHVFEADTLPTWIYPVNYPIRLYQWNIVKKALFTNTLVALPTGLGKTFIAAVVMYNYYRWFPQSKIVFTAPTRPLVTQQIEACFNICGISQTDTVELTGNIQQERRRLMWKTKRVFFLTPQILKNDLQARICPGEKIVCLVIDEAHKAQGNYAYTEIVKLMQQRQHNQYRMLALSATPGTNLTNVQSVISNLNIANIQIRTEDSMDIQEHSHGKNIQTVVVALDYTAGATGVVPEAAKNFRTKFFEPCLSRLARFQAVYSTNVEQNTPYQILMAQQQFSAHAKNFNQAVKSMVHNDFAIAGALSRAYDRLCQHGVGSFLSLIEGTLQEYQDVVDKGKHLPVEKGKLLRNYELKRMIDNLKQQQLQPGFIGHPKLQRLLHIILEHLSNEQSDDSTTNTNTATRIMIFSQYRSSVDEIVKVLSEHKPMVRCSHFVGQAGAKDGKKGLNQREQQDIITRFKRGDLNVLVSTSIGEEGLDIGEVDLIVCYDSQNSPLRLLQRMGRTGRKRKGRCVMLMTETEERKYKSAKESYNQVQSAISRGGNLEYFKQNPSVLPANYHPVWRKKRFTIGTFIASASSAAARKKRKTTGAVVNPDGLLTDDAQMEFLSKLDVSTVQEAFDKHWPKRDIIRRAQKYLPMNTKPLIHHRVGHSRRTMQFIQVYNKIEQRILHGVDAVINDYGQEIYEEGQEPKPTVGNTLYLPRRNKNTDGITIEARTIVPSSSNRGTNRKNDISTRGLDDHDNYSDDVLMIIDGKATETPTTDTTKNNNVLDLPINSKKQNTTIMQNKRQKSDISMTDVELPIENNNALLQRNSSGVSIRESDSLLRQPSSSPLKQQSPQQVRKKTNKKENKDNNNSNNNNAGFNLEDDYVPGDSWVEEYDSLLLLENRLNHSGSYERHDDSVNNGNNSQSKNMVIDELEDILPPHLQSNNNNDSLVDDNNNNNNNNYRSTDNDMELEHPFPFKQLTKETEEELKLSSSMIKWLTARPVPTDKAERKLKERARGLKLDAAKEWVHMVFSLPLSPMIVADEEPSFDDDLDIDMLDAIDQNFQQKRAAVEHQGESSFVQNEQVPNNDNSSNDNNQQQPLEEQDNDDMMLSPINSNHMIGSSSKDNSTHYSSSSKYDHCDNEQPQQQPVSVADNIPNNNDNNEEDLSNNNNSVMSDVTYYEILENKLDDENRLDSYGNEYPNNEPIIISNDHPSQEQEQSPSSTSSELSVINVRTRKRRRPIEFTEDNSSEIIETLPSSPSISTSPVMRRAIEGHRRRRQRLEEAAHNPFLALEAEKSSDEELMGSGHGNTDDDETGSTNTTENNSFINDDDTDPTSSLQQAPPNEEIYRMSLLSPDVTLGKNRVGGRRSWFDRFQGDKWIQAGEEEDEEDAIDLNDLGVGDDEDDETERTGGFEYNTSTIQEFTDEIIDQEYSDSDDFV